MMHARNVVPAVRQQVTVVALPGIDLEEFRRKNQKKERRLNRLIVGTLILGIFLIAGLKWWLPDM